MKKMKILKHVSALAFLVILINGCVVGPKYTGQSPQLPENFDETTLTTDTISTAEWWKQFNDPVLEALIEKTVANNLDLVAAASRVEQARLAAGVAAGDFYPHLSYQAGIARGDLAGTSQLAAPTNSIFALGLLNWEIDFWGKYRQAQNRASAFLMAADYSRSAIRLSVESETARLYFLLLDFGQRLEIARRTLELRRESVNIIQQRFDQGIIPEIDLNQAVIQEAEAEAAIPQFEMQIRSIKNALLSLMGDYSMADELFTGLLSEQAVPDFVPEMLPSDLLSRRPDILEAEQALIAQYASAGVAQSQRYPSINLSISGGVAGKDFDNLFSGSPAWSVGAGLFGPIFNFGQLKKLSQIEQEKIKEVEASYNQVVVNAFLEVNDVLNEIENMQQLVEIRQTQYNAAENAARLARERYDGGVTSYLKLLDSERALFNIELGLTQTRQELLNAYVKLFKALGGGW
jgi:outer membrane protein, multidrug efflux system